MRVFADELRESVGEAARKMAEARLAGDGYGAEAYHERLSHLHYIAQCHGIVLPPHSWAAWSDSQKDPA